MITMLEMLIISIITIIYFLLFILIRAYITKYLLLRFSIHTSSIFSLFKKYFLIFIILYIPFTLLGTFIYSEYEHLTEKFDLFLESNILIPIFYLLEAFLITKLIKDKAGNNIKFKMAFMLVVIFFITDTTLDLLYQVIEETFLTNVDDNFEDQVSTILAGEQ